MKVANLMTTDWSYGTTRKYDDYQEKQTYHPSPQLPLSPPADDQRKCSLPSISSLLEGADSMPAAKRPRHNSAEYNRVLLPPTPPMRPCSGLADGNSPSTTLSRRSHSASIASIASVTSIHSAPAMQQPQSQPQPQTPLPPISASLPTPPADRASFSSVQEPRMSPPASTSYRASPPAAAPATGNTFTAADDSAYPQRPQSVSPPSSHGPRILSPVNPAWQHHHYFPPSGTAAPYPQNHDRYVCRTCHKAFSRPSSLRIHSHSHTGEKPFRCAHVGCGKAFSVRSNMKRHERGCHSGRPLAAVV